VASNNTKDSGQKLEHRKFQEEILYCESDRALEEVSQRGCEVVFSGVIKILLDLLRGTCFGRCLNSVISRDPFQPLQFCDSVQFAIKQR